ncbi:hypothetical protein GALMADRAFT_244803 [Galerina marginata CBS 339.88]|uniref:VWFA domain-containing protein n=1 Tax=Galerina marginata (strain CBS 339.88) TaxID=685588 RepID=A0A067TJB7_GALM3|nr:hypothetical protein GALMADRAFT_244803 [Galerina marginata CBS 339.88]
MSSEPSEAVAIAFLVESSLSVALEWRKKISEYTSYLLKRLGESHPGCKPRVAFVTYGTADSVPSPILCKRFFADLAVVFKEMEDLSRLGLGMTNSGGTRGMAALEGFVATLELFDILLSHPPPKEGSNNKPIISHIIHIADSSPDASQHPSWNDSSALDNVNWDSLPLEMKKRNIQYNAISLHPNLPRFPELYAAVVTGGSTPWFSVRAPHTVLLAPFPPLPQSKASPTKRPNDLGTEPESKRPRIQPSTDSPKPAAKIVPLQLQTTLPPVTQPPRPAPTVPSQPLPAPINATPAKTKQQMLIDRLRGASEQLQQLESAISAAKSEGKAELAETLMQEYTAKKDHHIKVTKALSEQFIAAKAAQASAQGFPQREAVAPPFGLNNALSTGNLPSTSSNLSVGSDIAQMQHSRSLSETTFPTNNTTPAQSNAAFSNVAQNMSAQIQRIAEQQPPRVRPGHVPSHSLGGIPNQNIASAAARPEASSTHFNNAAAGPGHLPQPESAGNTNQTVAVWSGSLNWSGQGTTGRKEVRAYVIASTANASVCHANTWPKAFTLVPTKEPEVSMTDLQAWLKQHKPALCTFQVQNNIPDAKTNENNYRSLVQLLTIRKMFATAAWTTPSGGQTKNVLVFPVGSGLAGAFFALTGLPELPKPMSAGPVNPGPVFNIPPAMLAQMRELNPEQRNTIMAELHRRRQQQMLAQQQQQQQQQFSHNQDVNGTVPFAPTLHPPNHANMNAVLNMMTTQAPSASTIPMNTTQPTFPNTLPRPGLNPSGGVQGVSYEMMQSFVQRNADGNVNMNTQN